MDSKTLEKLSSLTTNNHPQVHTGDKVKLHMKIKEGSKERIQVFEGFVISTSGHGHDKTITVRKISSGVGVERIIPLNSPALEKLEILTKGNVKKSKLYYMRDRVGKASMKVRGRDALIEQELAVVEETADQEESAEDAEESNDTEEVEVKAEDSTTEEKGEVSEK